MLIEIDASAVENAIGNDTSAATSRECIENLLLAHHENKHVVLVEKAAATRLTTIQDTWGTRARGALRSIIGRHNEIRGLRDRLKWILRVGVGPEFTCKTVTVDGKSSVHASLQQFRGLAQTSAGSTLLAENLIDAKLYRILGEAFIAEKGWRWNLCFDEQQGGGDTTAPVLQKLVDEEKLTLAIVDSDRIHPYSPMGKTAQRASNVGCSALQLLHVLHVRDAENVIPSGIYEQAFANAPKLRQALSDFKEAEQEVSKHPWRDHADIKEGITLFDIAGMQKEEASFWRGVAKDLQRHQCTNPHGVSACGSGKKNRHCFVTPALSEKALATAVSWMERQDRKRTAKLIRFQETPRMVDLCEMILAWGIAEQRGLRA